MSEKSFSLGDKVYFLDEFGCVRLDSIIEFGFKITNHAGMTFQLLKMLHGNVIRCTDIISFAEAEIIKALNGQEALV